MKIPYTFCAVALLSIAANTYAADAPSDSPASADGSERCVPIKNIRSTEVVDDQNILFHMNNRKVYNNHLPQRCSGLAFDKAFKYETSQSQLCNLDLIYPLTYAGGNLMPGAACGLGLFVPAEPKKAANRSD